MKKLKMNPDLEPQKVQSRAKTLKQILVMHNHRMSVRMIFEVVNISVGTVDTILTEDLKLHKVCAKFVPKILSDDQRQF